MCPSIAAAGIFACNMRLRPFCGAVMVVIISQHSMAAVETRFSSTCELADSEKRAVVF